MLHFYTEDDKTGSDFNENYFGAVKERLSKTGRAGLNRLALPCLF